MNNKVQLNFCRQFILDIITLSVMVICRQNFRNHVRLVVSHSIQSLSNYWINTLNVEIICEVIFSWGCCVANLSSRRWVLFLIFWGLLVCFQCICVLPHEFTCSQIVIWSGKTKISVHEFYNIYSNRETK